MSTHVDRGRRDERSHLLQSLRHLRSPGRRSRRGTKSTTIPRRCRTMATSSFGPTVRSDNCFEKLALKSWRSTTSAVCRRVSKHGGSDAAPHSSLQFGVGFPRTARTSQHADQWRSKRSHRLSCNSRVAAFSTYRSTAFADFHPPACIIAIASKPATIIS
jgi:hypothetical protein